MTILGIETATPRLAVALTSDANPPFSGDRHTDSRSSHCELINGFIGELLAESGISLDSLDAVAVSTGPGSFTGLRIGIASAMGLAYALGIETCPVPTLMGLAWQAAAPGSLVCPLIDAKRREAYAAVYRCHEDALPEEVISPAACPVEQLAEKLIGLGEPVTLVGPAATLFAPLLTEHLGSTVISEPVSDTQPSASSIAAIGRLMASSGRTIAPAALTPLYLRRSDAEIVRDQKRCQS